MIGCSIKSLWRSSAAVLLFASASAPALEQSYQVRFRTELGYHLVEPIDLAIHRNVLRAETTIKGGEGSPWSASLGLRAYEEGALATNTGHFGPTVAAQESQEVVPRSLYVQYEDGPWQVRVGNQQVVWGEAFGFYFADIVNPKDLRQFGIGDLEDFRVPTPMVNAKWITGNYSLQALVIPKAFFNKMPVPGSDFFFPLDQYVPGATFNLHDDRTAPFEWSNVEYGARATALVSSVDISLFFLSYADRLPVYLATLESLAPTVVRLDAAHSRLTTLGATATADLGTFVLRAEALYNHDRSFNTLRGSSLSVEKSDEIVGVLGVDYTQLEKWQLGVQVSEDALTRDLADLIAVRTGPFLSLHLHGTPWRSHSLDLLFGCYPNDGSTLTELLYDLPLSDQLVFGVGANWFQGSPSSRLGAYRQGSRAFVQLRGYFNG